MLLPLDGPTLQQAISVAANTVIEAKVGASTQPERKVVTIQPVSHPIFYFISADGSTPTVSTVQNNGVVVFQYQVESLEVGTQKVFLLSAVDTTNVVVIERS